MQPAPCHVCATPTIGRVEVCGSWAAICSDRCAFAFAHELKLRAAIDAWLEAIPSEHEHGDPIHGAGGVLAQFRRGEWRTLPATQDEPTGVADAPEIPAVPGMERREGSGSPRDAQGGAKEEAEEPQAEKP